jgi:hypothetical protein
LKRDKIAAECREVLFGQIAQAVVNFGFRAPTEPLELKEFMPSHWRKTVTKPRRMSPKRRTNVAAEIRERMKWISGGLIVAGPTSPEGVNPQA